MARTKPSIGIVGGIGAGKSRVAAEFERQGCLVVDSDRLGREVLDTPTVLDTLRQWWGAGVVGSDGRADRGKIAAVVFADPAQKRRLEELVHPLIADRRRHMMLAVEHHAAIKAIVIDSPLLFENTLDRECDAVVFVSASEAERLRRVSESRGWNADELRRREQWQLSIDEKRVRAGFVIDNEGPPERLGPQVEAILQAILGRWRATQG